MAAWSATLALAAQTAVEAAAAEEPADPRAFWLWAACVLVGVALGVAFLRMKGNGPPS